MRKVIILEDHNGYTFTSLKNNGSNSIDNSLLKFELEKRGYIVEVESLHSHNLNNVMDCFVFYPSSEVNGLFYKEFIEDVLLDLQYAGAILLPKFDLFRAHHNKAFMERLRSRLKDETLNLIHSRILYDLNDLKKDINLIEKEFGYPLVLKMSSGSGARGVSLANNRKQLYSKFNRMSCVKYHNYSMPWYSSVRTSKIKSKISNILKHRNEVKTYPQEKIVIQNFIEDLQYDYKILVFGDKYYVLKRLNRKNDFRASGSGKLFFDYEFNSELEDVLTTAHRLFELLDCPLLSVDVAYDGKTSYVIEFQCTNFGPYTLQFSDKYYILDGENWKEIQADSVLEEEIAESLDKYIRKNY